MTPEDVKDQIEKAFHYRGHVTLRLKGGETVEGYLFNRQFDNPRMAEDNFVELMLKGSGDRRRLKIAQIESVSLTGSDCAAGNSYEDYLKKRAAQGKKA